MSKKRSNYIPHTDPKAPTLKAKDIEKAFLVKYLSKRYTCGMPNVYPEGYSFRNGVSVLWREFDLLGVRKSGYLDEVEVKLSKSDFKADFKKDVMQEVKTTSLNGCVTTSYEARNKHKMMEYGKGLPNYFYFLTLKDIVDLEDIPDYAGWVEAECEWNKRTKKWYITLAERKKPKLLHKDKASDDLVAMVYKKGYYRYIDSLFGG
jgi:hypothetical protein